MSKAPSPAEMFRHAGEEGRRRLAQGFAELAANGFVAGFTILLGILAMGATHAAAEPTLGALAKVFGALAFATGLVMLIVQRVELFSENFFDPVAWAFQSRERVTARIARLWAFTLLWNLVGGGLMVLIVSAAGMVPPESAQVLASMAEEMAARPAGATFASAIVGGVLVALLSYALAGSDGVLARIAMAYLVGFVLAIGPFDHVVVTVLHLLVGWSSGATIPPAAFGEAFLLATAGNLVGGVGLVTCSHAAQARAGRTT